MSSESFYKILVIIVTIWNSGVVGGMHFSFSKNMILLCIYLLICFTIIVKTFDITEQYNCVAKDFIRLGNSCYYFSTEIVSWQEAHFRCRGKYVIRGSI